MPKKKFTLLCSFMVPLIACLWDYDTVQMERQQFPDTLELITGKFLRHSDAYYQWRIEDRTPQLQSNPTPEIYDDLAVAYEKLGDHDKAIELMQKKESAFPGLYETRANLGTFYIHAGQLQRGLEEIEKAIEINPDAHFGREIYQKRLVEFVLMNRKDGVTNLPLTTPESVEQPEKPITLRSHLVGKPQKDEAHVNATKGILGMMRFGNFDSPVLLQALGDLLTWDFEGSGNMLAARAYLKASYEVSNPTAKAAYRDSAKSCLQLQLTSTKQKYTVKKLEAEFQKELQEAADWYKQVVKDEQQWIAEGVNVDEAFAKKYYTQPQIGNHQTNVVKYFYWVGGAGLIGLIIGTHFFVRKSANMGARSL